jgi:hypothetical protein
MADDMLIGIVGRDRLVVVLATAEAALDGNPGDAEAIRT